MARKQQIVQKPYNPQPQVFSADANIPRLTVEFSAGLNENTTPLISECSDGYNFNLAINQSAMVPRAPFDLSGTAPNAGEITAFLQLIKTDNTETTLVCAGNKVYLWDGAASFTVKATVNAQALLRQTVWALGNYMVITDLNLNNVVAKWDGTTYGALTTGLASTLSAKYAIVHLNRVWLFNIKYGAQSFPHMILACKFEDPTVWDTALRGGATTVGGGVFTTGLEAFYLFVPDLKEINGVALFQNTLIISTEKGRLWSLSGSSGATFQFGDFFDNEPSVGNESVSGIGNDVTYISRGGKINLLSATQNFGNVKTFTLSRWLPVTTMNMGTVNKIVYDTLNQRVLFFITGKVLVLFKDLMAQDRYQLNTNASPWSVYITDDTSGFNTSDARFMLIPGTMNYSVFFGDDAGRIFNLYGVGSSGDAGLNPIAALRRSRHIGVELFPKSYWPWSQENITGHLRYRRISPVDATVTLDWDDEYATSSNVLSLKGPPSNDVGSYFGGDVYFGGAFYFNSGFAFARRVSSMNLSPGGKGPGFYLSVSTVADEPYQIDGIDWD